MTIRERSIFKERVIEGRETELVLKPFVIFRSVREVAKHLKMKEWKVEELIGKIICPISYFNKNGQEVLLGYADMLEMTRYGASYVASAPEWLDVVVKTRVVKDKKKPKYNGLFYADGRPRYLIIKDANGKDCVRRVGATEIKGIPKFKLIQKANYGRSLSKLGFSEDAAKNDTDNGGHEEEEADS